MQRQKELHLPHPEAARLSYCFCGYHDCPSGYAYGQTVRDEYILHFVSHGSGFYRIDKNTFRVSQGSSFVLFPGHILHYQADKADPWEYYWVAFTGKDAQNLLESIGIRPADPIVMHRDPDEVRRDFRQMLSSAAEQSVRASLETMTLFYRILTCVAAEIPTKNDTADGAETARDHNEHIQRAVTYIQENYFDHDLSVDTIARCVFLERSYFSTVFREYVGTPPHHFLIKVRMENACRMLSDSSMSIKEIAYAVGYREQSYFDKVFKKSVGQSPSEYRESVREALAGGHGSADAPEQLDRSFFS